jgi:hypothetical protein
MTTQLALQQMGFFRRVVAPETSAQEDDSLLTSQVVIPERQLAVYQRAYLARLVECVRDDYPLLIQALGDEPFDALATQYVREFPPETNSLNFYSRHFATFLRSRVPLDSSWAYDLARVEWALIEAIHADGSKTLTSLQFGRLAPEDWPRLRLQTSPTLRVLTLNYDISPLVLRLSQAEAFVAPAPGQSFLAVCRRGNDLWRLPLEPWAAALLEHFERGYTLGGALEQVAQTAAQFATEEQVFRTFSRWLEAGVFCSAEAS